MPNCGSDARLSGILRGEWDFDGIVFSDGGATQMIGHPPACGVDPVPAGEWGHCRTNYTADDDDSVAVAVKAGVDAQTGGVYFSQFLPSALASGKISATDIQNSSRRLFSNLLRLGLFDGAARDYTNGAW